MNLSYERIGWDAGAWSRISPARMPSQVLASLIRIRSGADRGQGSLRCGKASPERKWPFLEILYEGLVENWAADFTPKEKNDGLIISVVGGG